jgi:hypothetical protein
MQGRTQRLGIGIVGTVILATVEAMTVRAGIPATDVLLNFAIGLTYLYGGLAVWAHDPANRTGRLMTAVGLTWFLPSLALTENPAVDIGNALYDVPSVLLFALIMAYPSGHLSSRFDRASVAILVVAATALNVLQLVPEPLIINEGSNGLLVGLGLSLMTAVAILRRWYVALPGSREELLPVLIAGAVFVAGLMINLVRRIFEVSDTLGDLLQAANELAPAAIPIALLIGFYRRSELRLQALVDAIPDQILRVARDGPAIDIRMRSVVGTTVDRSDRAGPARSTPSAAFASETAMAATARALDEGGLQSFDYAIDQPEGRREFEVRLAASGPDEVTAIMRDFTKTGLFSNREIIEFLINQP